MALVPEIIPLFLTSEQDIDALNNQITINLPFPIQAQNMYVALAKGYFYYSNPNCAPQYHNQTYQYIWVDGSVNTVTMPAGNYQFSDMLGFFQLIMTQNTHYLIDNNGNQVFYLSFVLNQILYALTFTALPVPSVLPAGWSLPPGATWVLPAMPTTPQFVIPPVPAGTSFGVPTMFGLPAGTYPPAPIATEYQTNSTAPPQISAVINFNLTCNLVSASAFNANAKIIYTLFPTVAYGALQTIEPVTLTYFKVADGMYNQVVLALTDQDNIPLPMIDPTSAYYLYLVKGVPSTSNAPRR